MPASIYGKLVRPCLFRFDPERIHKSTLSFLRVVGGTSAGRALLRAIYGFDDRRLNVRVGELCFPNPVGLAAGFDKNGVAARALANAGFGFVEIGSVSAHRSTGNAVRPRLFRLPDDEAVVVYYGVPNDGAEAVARRLDRVRLPVPLGINLVETNTGQAHQPAEAIQDLAEAARPLAGVGDYLAINLSCPNAPCNGVFNDMGHLRALLERYAARENPPPTFLKPTSTTDPQKIERFLAVIDDFPFVRGCILGTISSRMQPGLKTPREFLERIPGALCGKPTRLAANEVLRAWYPRIDRSRHALISAGGIASAEDAYERIRLGATLVEIYSALIFQGPGLVKKINANLCRLLERDGFGTIGDAVGVDCRPLQSS